MLVSQVCHYRNYSPTQTGANQHLAEVTGNVAALASLAKPGTKLAKQCLEASSLLADILSRGQTIDLDDKAGAVAGSTEQRKVS